VENRTTPQLFDKELSGKKVPIGVRGNKTNPIKIRGEKKSQRGYVFNVTQGTQGGTGRWGIAELLGESIKLQCSRRGWQEVESKN